MCSALQASLVPYAADTELDWVFGRQIERNSVNSYCEAALLLREFVPKQAYGLYGEK